jgi:hypothetical protein
VEREGGTTGWKVVGGKACLQQGGKANHSTSLQNLNFMTFYIYITCQEDYISAFGMNKQHFPALFVLFAHIQ